MKNQRPGSKQIFCKKSASVSNLKAFRISKRHSEPSISPLQRAKSRNLVARIQTAKSTLTNLAFSNMSNNSRPQTCITRNKKIILFRKNSIKDNITRGESIKIREKLALYDIISQSQYFFVIATKNKRKSENNQGIAISSKQLTEKFEYFTSQINSLLADETPIKDIKPDREIPIELLAGRKSLFKLSVRRHPIPLKIRIAIQKGISGGHILFSNRLPRPTISNCDKCIVLKSKEVFGTYVGTKSQENLFMDDYVFITIEAEKDLTCSFQCVFGRRIFS